MGTEKPKFDESARVRAVFRSQGRAVSLADHMPESYQKKVAALCGADGTVKPEAVREFPKILRALSDEQKATVSGLDEKKAN